MSRRRRTIEIVPYDPAWPGAFATEAARIRQALGELALRVDHNGSTSIPGLAAKPTIDIQVSVPSLQPLSAYGSRLEGLGYIHTPHPDDSFAPFFYRPRGRPHSHHVHVVEHGGREERRALAFRDYLREHHAEACEYEQLKRALASQLDVKEADSLEPYVRGKTAFIERIIARAFAAAYAADLRAE